MAADDGKRFYWLKLKKGFFQQHQIKVLKSLPNGRLYALIYLELLDESITHNGELRFSEMLPYDMNTLAAVIDEDKDNVEKAIQLFIKFGLAELLDDQTIYMTKLNEMVGSETGAAARKREQRGQLGDKGGQCLLENRDKNIEDRIKSLYIIIKQRFIEAGIDEQYMDSIETMMIKAAIQTDVIPSVHLLNELTARIIDDNSIYNKQGYIVQCFMNNKGEEHE